MLGTAGFSPTVSLDDNPFEVKRLFDKYGLAPHRLLLYVHIADPDDNMTAKLKLNGLAVELIKANTMVTYPHPGLFVGFYADVSSLEPDKLYQVELELSEMKPGQYQGLFFANVETEYTGNIQ